MDIHTFGVRSADLRLEKIERKWKFVRKKHPKKTISFERFKSFNCFLSSCFLFERDTSFESKGITMMSTMTNAKDYQERNKCMREVKKKLRNNAIASRNRITLHFNSFRHHLLLPAFKFIFCSLFCFCFCVIFHSFFPFCLYSFTILIFVEELMRIYSEFDSICG